MKKKRTLQNNLSYALKYMFGNYGINIFLDSKKFIVTLDNLIPNLQEETNLVKFAIQKNAISAIVNAYDQRDIDKNFAYLRAKTILTKNGVSEKATTYLLDCFLYAFDWIDDVPDYEDLSDEDFIIAKIPEKSIDNFSKKLETQLDSNKVKKMSTVKLNKKDISDNKDNEPNKNTTVEKVEPLHFEEKSLSSKKEIEDDNISKKEDDNMKNDKHKTKTNSKYYLNHDFDDNDENYNYEYDDDDEYYDDESGSLLKKIALILITIAIIGGIGFFAFKNLNKDADVTFNGVSITSEYQMDNDTYVLPISEQTTLEVVMDSTNSKPIDTNKLRFKLENGSICNFQSSGKKCTITGLAKGSTKLIIIYNNEIIGTVPLYFKYFTQEEDKQNQKDNTEEENTTTKQDTSSSDNTKNNSNKNSNNNNTNKDSNKNKDNNKDKNKDNNKDNSDNKPKPIKPEPEPEPEPTPEPEPKPEPEPTPKPEPEPEPEPEPDPGNPDENGGSSGENNTTTESSNNNIE